MQMCIEIVVEIDVKVEGDVSCVMFHASCAMCHVSYNVIHKNKNVRNPDSKIEKKGHFCHIMCHLHLGAKNILPILLSCYWCIEIRKMSTSSETVSNFA